MPSYKQDNFKESNVKYLNKDFNETSPGMMLIEMSAYVGDVLSFYIDQQYKEMLLPLAEERRNVINMAKMFGYKVKPIVPAYTDLTFTTEVNADSEDSSKVDYTDAATWGSGIEISSVNDSSIIFSTLEPIDFTISSSTDTDTIRTTDTDSGLATSYTLSRTVRAVSATEKIKTFNIGAPKKFLKLTIEDKNVIDIVSCIDTNGNSWYEVDYLAQDKVPIPTHYTEDAVRNSAYSNLDGIQFDSDVPVPYSLQYIATSKRFIREINEDNSTSLIFGNGILRNGTTIDEPFLDLEQAGIVIPGQANDLETAINPLLGNEYSTLGETPIQTTLTVTYRVGGGIESNVASGEITEASFGSLNPISNNSSADALLLTATNVLPAAGGKDQEDIEEIREKTKAFFSTQNRCVTKEDYEARVMNIPSKFGNIAKVYVTRELTQDVQTVNLDTTINNLQTVINGLVADEPITDTEITNLQGYVNDLPSGETTIGGTGEIRIYILSYDRNKNLVGNPAAPQGYGNNNVPAILKNNIAKYVDNFRILTDTVDIMDGFIINFGVIFDVVAHKYANKQQVKLLCIQKIKDYFKIQNMQFSQPIYVSQLEYELMGIEGVRAVNYVTVTQKTDYNSNDYDPDATNDDLTSSLPVATFTYSIDTAGDLNFDGENDVVITVSSETDEYGWSYNFEDAFENGVILPPHPESPGVFELKNPNQNIRGVVR